jgi:hypothetical protein
LTIQKAQRFSAKYSNLWEEIERETNLIVLRATRIWGNRFNFVAHHINSGKRACSLPSTEYTRIFLSARKADLKKGFQHLVHVLVVVVLVVCTRVKNCFLAAERDSVRDARIAFR